MLNVGLSVYRKEDWSKVTYMSFIAMTSSGHKNNIKL